MRMRRACIKSSFSCLRRIYIWRKWILPPFLLILWYVISNRKTLLRNWDYYQRPLWGHVARKGPPNVIPHFYAERVPPQNRCVYHNWTPRSLEDVPKVYDAFTFSVELDLLEIRLRELWSVVDYFLVVESDRNFQGKEKPLVFQNNQKRFEWAKEKIRHFVVTTLSPNPTGLFENEARMRSHITGYIQSLSPNQGDLIISSDIDEIPSQIAIELVKACKGYGPELHFLVDEFMYSFEFPLKTTNWRPHVTIYDPRKYWFHHIILPDTKDVLADAGWHCTFCFRYISEFVFKMTSYSHTSMITDPSYVNPADIQRRICEGIDIFEAPPEAYSIRDYAWRMGIMEKRQSTRGIPSWVVEETNKFRFLLPGGCVRDDYKNPNSPTI